MKNIYLFLLIFILIGCETNQLKVKKTISVDCPTILYSQEHKIYIDTLSAQDTLNNLELKAEINNAMFLDGCKMKNKDFSSDISLLFVINPLSQLAKEDFILPFYIGIIDKNFTIKDIQYYSVKGSFKKNLNNNLIFDNEINFKTLINYQLDLGDMILIGFMIDENQNKLIN